MFLKNLLRNNHFETKMNKIRRKIRKLLQKRTLMNKKFNSVLICNFLINGSSTGCIWYKYTCTYQFNGENTKKVSKK